MRVCVCAYVSVRTLVCMFLTICVLIDTFVCELNVCMCIIFTVLNLKSKHNPFLFNVGKSQHVRVCCILVYVWLYIHAPYEKRAFWSRISFTDCSIPNESLQNEILMLKSDFPNQSYML